MDQFTKAYIVAALWSSIDDKGKPLDINYGVDDIDPATLTKITEDCQKFQKDNADDIATWDRRDYSSHEMAGYDFWLTRNGHGSGFWDGNWKKKPGERLTKSAKSYGEFTLYVGDDGKIYE